MLRERPSAAEARQLVEKILDVAELRARAAIVLEAVYTERDEVPELVRVLEIHLEFATGADERRDLLRRVAELRDERLRDDAGALDAFARLLPLDPDDARARHRMLEIARRLSAHERAAGVLTATAAAAAAPLPRAEILMDVARLYEGQLDDAARADAMYRQVLQLAPDDASIALPACRSLERIYAAAGDNRQLCDILRIEVKLEDDAEARRELRGRLGELCETVLDDPRGAIEAWRARLEDDPGDAQALSALDRLYERTQSWRELVEVLRARERMAEDKDARRALIIRIATTLADQLTDVPEAILAYRTVVDDFGADRASLSSLATLYELADRWQDLADTLEADLALADSATDKLSILARLGEVRQKRLGDVTGAIEAYRQALVLDPSHPGCRAALEAMLDDVDARREAASILRPLYEADGLHQKLLRVLEIEAEYAESISEKLANIAQAAQVAEGPLADGVLALSYAARGLRGAVAEPELPQWIERAERLAAATGRHAELVELLRSVVGEILDGDVQLEVTLRIAEIARTRLGDPALAQQHYAKALELRGDDRRALLALQSLYEETGDYPALLDVVKRSAEAAENEAERKELLFKQAKLSDEKLGDARSAIGVYEQILDLGLDAEAIASLERLYAQAERWEDLVALDERQIAAPGVSPERKAALHHALGNVLERRMNEIDRAFEQYAAALAIDAKHPQTVASLEALMAGKEHGATAAEMLEPVYLARLDWRRVMATLEARLESSQDPDERRQLLRRLAKMHEEQEENYSAALETTAKLLAEDPTDEGTWAELERLARVANAEARLAGIFASELEKITSDEPSTARLAQRTGELFEMHQDVERALVFFRRAHAFDPEAKNGTFEAIDRLLRQAGRPRDRVQLYRDSLDYKNEPAERLDALHTIALIEETELHDDAAAIETYRATLEVDDEDVRGLEALSRLYARTERWRDLADMTRRRAEQTALPEDEARFRMDLAKLLLDQLGEPHAGIDELQIVVDLAPPAAAAGPGAEAVRALEHLLQQPEHKARIVDILRPIYERADDWRHLVAVNGERLALATDDGDRIAILRETAELWEKRGGDRAKAFDAMRDAWTLDPEDGDAREQLDRLAGATQRWDDLAAAYEDAIAKTDGLTKRELLAALAQLHDKRRDDPRRALDAWDRLFQLDETELQPLEEMDALATLLSDWTTLVRVLTRKAELLPDDETRASTWRRVGEAKRDMLDDLPGAIEAYERALELEASSAFTLDNLIALYEQKNDAARLVDLYRRRVELCGEDDEGLRFQLLVDAAGRFEKDLSDRREAIESLVQALMVRPGDGDVLRRLDALYTQERLWPELLENLKLQAGAATDDAARRALKKRIAALYAVELQDPQASLETYREVLESGFDAEAAAAIRSIGETNDELRGDAADALEPVLRAAGRHEELAAVLELRLRAQTEAADRAKTLRAMAEVAEKSLGDADRAQSALLRALAEEPQDAALHLDIERLAATAGADGWKRYADALQERAVALFDANVAADLFVRLGKVSEDKLDDPARASKAYVSAAERMGDDPAVLGALDRLFARLGDARALADVLERRIAVESLPATQADLLHRLASLQIDEFKEKSQGLATLRQALERVPDHAASRAALEKLLEDDALFDDAFDALEFVLRALGLSEELAKLYERRVTRARVTRDRTHARLELARVLEERVGDRARAQRAVEAAVADDPSDDEALQELERLAASNGAWAEAAEALGAALEAAQEMPGATRTDLWVRLAGWRRDKLQDARRAEDDFARALAIDPENVDVLKSLEDIRRAPGRERELVHTLRTRARLEGDLATKRDLLREAKALAEGTVGDRELAEAVLRDLVAEDEGDRWALEELTKLRGAAGDDAEVVRLLLRRAELVVDGAEGLSLKHEAARVVTEKLNDASRATTLYEEILESEPTDARAADALRTLYAAAGRYKDLAKLLSNLVDVASTQAERAALRLELAELQRTRFASLDDAIETLRGVLDEDPTHAEAVLRLSHLYEQTGRDAELADLLKGQLDAARDRGDVDGELALLVRLGDLQEGRLGDVTAAQETYEQVLTRDPAHRGGLEAVARISEKRADWERAAEVLARLVEQATDSTGVAWALRLTAAREKMGDASGAEAALQQGLKLEPDNADLRGMLRVRYEKAEKWAELAALLVGDADVILAANPDAKVTMPEPPPKGASIVPGRSMAPGASTPPPPVVPQPVADQLKLLRQAADIHLTKRKSAQDAIPILERAAALVPHDRDLLLALCDAYNTAERGREAAQVLEKVIASFGARRTKELALYHHRLARALAQLGDKDVALSQLDMAFKIDPGVGERPAGPRCARLRDERPRPGAEDVPRAAASAPRPELGHLQGRGLLLPRRDQREAGGQGEGRADVRARDRERSAPRAGAEQAIGDEGLTSSRGELGRALLGVLLGLVARLWLATLRVHVVVHPALERVQGRPWVLAFWHGTQWPLLAWRRRRRTVVLVSLSRDGAMQARALALQGLRVVRGSSSRGGIRGLAQLVRAMKREALDAAFAVDGPRGPLGVVKGGARGGGEGDWRGGGAAHGVDARGARAEAHVGPLRHRVALQPRRGGARGADRSRRASGRARGRRALAGGAQRGAGGGVTRRVVSIDGAVLAPDDAKVSVYDRGFLYGDAVFEVLRTYGGRPFVLGEHLARLRRSAERVLIRLPVDEATLGAEVEAVIAAARADGAGEAYVRIVVTRGRGPLSLDPDTASHPLRVVLVEPVTPPPRDTYLRGVALALVATRRAVDDTAAAGAKVGNYLSNLLALHEAKARGAQEALIVDARGHVVEGASSNVFVVTAGRVATPPESAGILAGITRAHVLAAARDVGIPVDERALLPDDVFGADEVFITSSIRELAPRRPRRRPPHRNRRPGARGPRPAPPLPRARRHGRRPHAVGMSARPLRPDRHHVDLDLRALREGGDLHRGPRREGRLETRAVGLVDLREVPQVDEVDRRPHDVAEAASRRRQHGAQVLHHALRLLRDVPLDELPGRRVQRDLPAEEHELPGAHGLRVRPDGGRSVLRRDGVLRHAPHSTAPLQTLSARQRAPHRDGIGELEIAPVGHPARDARHRHPQRRELPLQEQRRRLAVHARRRRHDHLRHPVRRGSAPSAAPAAAPPGRCPPAARAACPARSTARASTRRARSPSRSCTRATTQSTLPSRLPSVHTSHSARPSRISAMFPHRSHGPTSSRSDRQLRAQAPRQRLVGRQQPQRRSAAPSSPPRPAGARRASRDAGPSGSRRRARLRSSRGSSRRP